jgi:hypothetical protein
MVEHKPVHKERMLNNAWTKDHLLPRAYGGKTIVMACHLCNQVRSFIQNAKETQEKQDIYERYLMVKPNLHSDFLKYIMDTEPIFLPRKVVPDRDPGVIPKRGKRKYRNGEPGWKGKSWNEAVNEAFKGFWSNLGKNRKQNVLIHTGDKL